VNDQLPDSEGSIVKNLLFRPLPTSAQDLVLLATRVLLGVVLIAHGWQKVDQQGYGATADGFEAMGIPAPGAAAAFAIAVELGGGALLVLGFLTRVVGVLAAANMAGAFWFAHREAGLFSADGGWELVGVIGALALVFAAVGPGRVSVDGALGRDTGVRKNAEERELEDARR
jgi:putative oxidoreductase